MDDLARIIETLKMDVSLNRSPDNLGELAAKAHIESYDKGQYVFTSGEKSEYVHIVDSGKIIMSKEASSGKAFTFLIATRGMPLNAVNCFMKEPRFFSARVAEKAKLVVIPSGVFKKWVVDHPDVASGILDTIGNLLEGTFTRILDLIDQSAENRILNALNMLSHRIGTTLPLTNTDVAEMTGVSRETAARIISQLQKMKLISKSRGAIEILDIEQLKELSTSPFFTI